MADHHLFISYARVDNQPREGSTIGWVTAFVRRLEKQHLVYADQNLLPFFDETEIKDGQDWWLRISSALKSSSLFIACLSPAYLNSEICRLEWETWLQFEHNKARGNDGVKTIYCVDVDGLFDKPLEQFDKRFHTVISDFRRRNQTSQFNVKPWFPFGANALLEIDAEERLSQLRADPASDTRNICGLADAVGAMDRAIAQRLDQVTLASLAVNTIPVSYRNFVGRRAELVRLHMALSASKTGLVGALHGLGGLGKTALAVQYAHAYAGHYAAGGCWIIGCEGVTSLAEVFRRLAGQMQMPPLEPPAHLDEQGQDDFTIATMLGVLEKRLEAGAEYVTARLNSTRPHTRPEDRPGVPRRILLILDNVDTASLFTVRNSTALAATHWLEIIVTTRVDPSKFRLAAGDFEPIAIDSLPEVDALELLRQFRVMATEEDVAAGKRIVKALDGFTLLVEITGAWLGANTSVSWQAYADRLERDKLRYVESRAGHEAAVRYDSEGLTSIVAGSLKQLSPEAREALFYAALMPADEIVSEWLRFLVAEHFPALAPEAVEAGEPDPWDTVLEDLEGRRLLVPSRLQSEDGSLRLFSLHRMVGDALRQPTVQASKATAQRREALIRLSDEATSTFEWLFPRQPQSVIAWLAPLTSLSLHLADGGDDVRIAQNIGVCGTALMQRSGLVSAWPLFQRGHEIFLHLFVANPRDGQAARDLSVSHSNIGDALLRRGQPGDLEQALTAYGQSKEILQRLHDANPGDGQAARDLSVSHNKIGDALLRRRQPGDLEQALRAYRQSKDIRQRLQTANPEDGQAARDLSVSYDNIGDDLLRRGQPGDLEQALTAFRQSKEIRQRLHDANPGDGQAARDLSVSHSQIGDVLLRRGQPGDLEQALTAYGQSKEILQRLYDANPEDGQAVGDLSVSLERLALIQLAEGPQHDPAQARTLFAQALRYRTALAAAAPLFEDVQREAIITLDLFLRACHACGDMAAAEEVFTQLRERIIAYFDAGFEAHPDIVELARSVGFGSRIDPPSEQEIARMRDEILADLPTSWSAAWCDVPPLRLDWIDVAGPDAAMLLARIDHATEGGRDGRFTRRHPVEAMRVAPLAFYPDHLLVDIQVSAPTGEGPKPAIASLVFGPCGVSLLDGTSTPIHELNRATAIKLDGEAAQLGYLRFFCAFVRGEEGPFLVIEQESDLRFAPDVSATAKAELTGALFAPRAAAVTGGPDGSQGFEAVVHYGPALFKSQFAVEPNGMIHMIEDDPVAQEVPLLRRRYQDIYRLPF